MPGSLRTEPLCLDGFSPVCDEFDSVQSMLKRAGEFGMEVPVVLEFFYLVRGNPGMGVEEAAYLALTEWDC